MLVEATHCVGLPVVSDKGQKLGTVDQFVFDGAQAKIVGLQVVRPGVLKKFSGLFYDDIRDASRQGFITQATKLQTNLKELDEISKKFGKVIGINAVTESGQNIGRVSDIIFDADTGRIVRFVVRNFLKERIIPRQFLVSITPKTIVFQDVVETPVFDKVATMPAPEAA